jgi:SH3-like domain-containing protein
VRKTVLVLALLLAGTAAASAQPAPGGRLGTGMPVPRYVSLKTDRVNLREGPSKDHRTAWVYQRSGLPVEIVAEYETWRRIRDAEGTEGWVLHSLLSGKRTAQVMPWAKGKAPPVPMLVKGDEKAPVIARLEPGVITTVKSCATGWCQVVIPLPGARDMEGFVRQDRLWGVYPNEEVE